MRIGVDVGGTKIEVIALDDGGRALLRRRVPTPVGDYEATLDAVVGLVRGAEAELGLQGSVGVGAPGSVSRLTGRVKNSNSTVLNGRTLREDLASRLGRPVRLANDADCFALSEATDGAAAGRAVVFGVILGTGVGGGIVVRGRLLAGPNAIAGEWGHNPLAATREDERPGPACYCGRRGCVKTWLSGPGLAADYARRSARAPIDARDVGQRAAAGEPCAVQALDAYADRLARSLTIIVNIVDPDVIVLGGGLSNLDRLYHDVPAKWGRYVFSDDVRTELVRNRHGDASGVRGAAWLGAAE